MYYPTIALYHTKYLTFCILCLDILRSSEMRNVCGPPVLLDKYFSSYLCLQKEYKLRKMFVNFRATDKVIFIDSNNEIV